MVRQPTDDKLDALGANINETDRATAKADAIINTTYSIKEKEEAADFETAISATGFGKFNIILFMIALPSAWSSEFDFTAISYVVPAAQCDLRLTLVHKGILNAMSYLGSLTSAFLWGFLADTMGRRKLLIIGYFADTIFVLLSSLSQTSWMLGVTKFMNGFLISGPYAILMSFISEFHCTKYRAPILLLSGMFFSLGNVALSGLAWWIIPQHIAIPLGGNLEIHSWQIYLMVCAIPSLVSACAYLLVLPESPKFLMTAGQNEQALAVFQRVYSMNTGNPPEYFPIKRLIDETNKQENKKVTSVNDASSSSGLKGVLASIRTGWRQIRPIFAQPHLTRIAHIFFTLFLGMLGENTLRLWMPQLFTKIDEYNQLHNYTKTASLCEMLEVPAILNYNHTNMSEEICTVTVVNNQVYINTIIVAMTNVVGFIIASSVVNRLGKKWLLVIIYGMCGLTGIGNYWSSSPTVTLVLVALYGGVSSVCTSTMISVIVDLFPTTLRTMTISLSMMTGRSGSIIGNVLFPVLLQMGCLPPFLLIGGTALVCSIMCIFLPDVKLASLD